MKVGSQSEGPNPSVEFEADDPDNPVNFFINETIHGEIIFRNDGDAIGYQPFLEVVLPNEITDFKMFYLDNSIETMDMGVFSEENNYTLLNPLTNKEVKGEAGQRFILAISPFGSYSSDIPDAVIEIEAFLNTTNVGVDAALDVILHDSIPSILEDVEYKINNGDWQEFTGDIYLRTILGNSKVTVEIRGIVNSGYLGNITNFANVSTSTSETDYTNNNDTVTGEVTAITDLKVVKEANDLTVVAGDNITYTVTITNYGPSDAVNVELRDYFDTSDLLNMQYSLDNVHWYSYAPGTVIQVGTIVSGDGRVIYFKALVNGSIRGNILNTVNITTDTHNEGENSSTVTTDVVEHVTISIDKTANVTNVNPGDYISYDIVVEVSDVSDVINVVVTDNLNSDLLETSNTIYFIDGVYKGRWTGSVNLGTLHPAAVVFIHLANIYVKNTADSDIPNTAIVTSDEYPNGFQSDYDIHLNTADLAVDKEVVSSGNYTDEIEYVITVTNNGPDDATGVVVSDKLPNGLIFTDSVADRGSYDPNTGI